MNEAELVSHLLSRNEVLWVLIQWWVSISFAIMIAAYIGVKHLTHTLIGLIIFMYAFYSFIMVREVTQHLAFSDPIANDLSELAGTSQLGSVGQAALNQLELGGGILMPVFLLFVYLITNGFVVFCYIKLKQG